MGQGTLMVSTWKGDRLRTRVLDRESPGLGRAITKRSGIEFAGRIWTNGCGWVHRDGGPAIEWDNGSKGWYRNGFLRKNCIVS